MPTIHVYKIRSTVDDTRPILDFDVPENRNRGAEILSRIQLQDSSHEPVHMTVEHDEAEDWDCYSCGEAYCVISERAMSILGPAFLGRAKYVPILINGSALYFAIYDVSILDCLNFKKSKILMFPHDQHRIMRISNYYFKKRLIPDPCIFSLPEGPFGMFGTDGVELTIRTSELSGFSVLDAETA